MPEIRSVSPVEKLLKTEKVLSVAGQLGGTNTRLVLCTESGDQVNTHVYKLQGKSSFDQETGLRKDIALMKDIFALAAKNTASIVDSLPITLGVAGFPSTRSENLQRAGLKLPDGQDARDELYTFANVNASQKGGHFLNFASFLKNSFKGQKVEAYLKTEGGTGIQSSEFIKVRNSSAIDRLKVNMEVINDGKAQARYVAAYQGLPKGANLLHLILGTGSNFEAAHNWSASSGEFETSLNTEHGHRNITQAPLFLKLRYIPSDPKFDGKPNYSEIPAESITFEKAFAGGSHGNHEFLMQGFFDSLKEYFTNPNRERMDISPFIKRVKDDIKGQLQYNEIEFVDFSGRDITQFYDNYLKNSRDYSRSLEAAAKAGNKFALACVKLWTFYLADSINLEARLYAKPPGNQKYHLSISGSHGLGLLGIKNDNLDAMELFESKLDDDLFEKRVLECRPRESMDGLIENAELQARAALERVKG